jgi:protoporphyrin/coproporphyrin ferrochelatase
LETLEEIDVENRNAFLEAGGGDFRYICALNDRPEAVAMLVDIVSSSVGDWLAGHTPLAPHQHAGAAGMS